MTEKVDVLVIGGGIVGVCAAHYLAGRGRQVALVEQGEIASGSSYGNAGLIVPSHCTPLAAPGVLVSGLKWMLDPESPFYVKPRLDLDLIKWLLKFTAHCTDAHVRYAIPVLRDLSDASLALFDQLSALGFDFGYERRGLLLIYKTEEGLRGGVEEARVLAGAGVTSKTLDAREVCALEPTVRPGMAGAVYFPMDAHLNPAEFVRGLARFVESKGVRIHANTAVTGIEKTGRRIETVKTTNGDFQPSEVVVAAGAWSPLLARSLKLRVRVPIQPAKGYSITVKRPAAYPVIPMLLDESRVAVTPMDSASGPILRFAGTLELAGMDLSINQRRVDAMRRAARNYLVEMGELETIEVWGGLRPCTPDGLPIVGRPESCDNLTIAAGHAMIGISLGPVTGKLVSQIICGEKTDVDLKPLRVERF